MTRLLFSLVIQLGLLSCECRVGGPGQDILLSQPSNGQIHWMVSSKCWFLKPLAGNVSKSTARLTELQTETHHNIVAHIKADQLAPEPCTPRVRWLTGRLHRGTTYKPCKDVLLIDMLAGSRQFFFRFQARHASNLFILSLFEQCALTSAALSNNGAVALQACLDQPRSTSPARSQLSS